MIVFVKYAISFPLLHADWERGTVKQCPSIATWRASACLIIEPLGIWVPLNEALL
jgi:hypothetical protein